jgi:hypothetical protein
VTLGIYSHWFRNVESNAASRLEEGLFKPSGQKVGTDNAAIRRIA